MVSGILDHLTGRAHMSKVTNGEKGWKTEEMAKAWHDGLDVHSNFRMVPRQSHLWWGVIYFCLCVSYVEYDRWVHVNL